jgi:hypothetical protein
MVAAQSRAGKGAANEGADVRFGSKADMCGALCTRRCPLSPNADMCGAITNVRFVPKADILGVLLDHLISGVEQALRDS